MVIAKMRDMVCRRNVLELKDWGRYRSGKSNPAVAGLSILCSKNLLTDYRTRFLSCYCDRRHKLDIIALSW